MKKILDWLLTPLFNIIAIFVGRSDNSFVTPWERMTFYKQFMSKIDWYWKNQSKHDLDLCPIETMEGLDVVGFRLAKWIRKNYPNAKCIKYNCGRLMVDNSVKIQLPRNIEASLMLFNESNGFGQYMNFELLFEDALIRHIGVCTNVDLAEGTFEWVLDGKSDEEKIIDFVKRNVQKGDTIELTIFDSVSTTRPSEHHKPGTDCYWDTFVSFSQDNVNRDNLIGMLDNVYGEHQCIDGIVPVIVWVA